MQARGQAHHQELQDHALALVSGSRPLVARRRAALNPPYVRRDKSVNGELQSVGLGEGRAGGGEGIVGVDPACAFQDGEDASLLDE